MLTNSFYLARALRALVILAFASCTIEVAAAHTDTAQPALQIRKSSSSREMLCLATAIYFEARGESERGQLAVAEVIMTRAKTAGRPKTICGVVYEGAHRRGSCQFSFACDGRSDVARDRESWADAKDIAQEALESRGRIVKGATYFHVASIRPRWASRMVRVAKIGTHIFYRPRSTG